MITLTCSIELTAYCYLFEMASLFKRLCLPALTLLTLTAALPASDVALTERDTACTNGPFTRACWKNGYRYVGILGDPFNYGHALTYRLALQQISTRYVAYI